uniref:Phlebovirus_G2 domain-containing protein n=1 Tax=Elaeophora elaphi TaxID=1147741 RepID=A0A0R3RR82_9BILA
MGAAACAVSLHPSNECPILGNVWIRRNNANDRTPRCLLGSRNEMIAHVIIQTNLASTLVISNVLERRNIEPCPAGSRPMYRPDGQPRKCLPHQNSLCVNALPDQPNAATVCCWHNQVDYFCCLDVTPLNCPDYHNVTVVVHNAYPQNPFALRSFHFREGIEDEIAAMTQEIIRGNTVRTENDFLTRRNSANN